jgi:hypothetical protein
MKISFTYPTFPDHTIPVGALPREKGAQACFYFYLLAQKQKELVGDSTEDQILLEGELWMDTKYVQTARTVALIYGLESPDEFAKFWKFVKQEAWVCELPIPHDSYTKLAPGVIVR